MDLKVAGRERDPDRYQRHALHSEERVWVEKNCYVDIWIELVHALDSEPLAMLPFTVAVDFEDDQWTFFKPPHPDLWDLYGIDVQEMTAWQPLVRHALTQLAAGKLISTEADSFFLPDTRGTDYRQQHVKTTIIVEHVDLQRRALGYFHNAGYYQLEGDDFDGLFRTANAAPTELPLYAELIRIDRQRSLAINDLKRASLEKLRYHLGRRPSRNPLTRFAQSLDASLTTLAGDLPAYHQYAFATIRQFGAAFELLSLYLHWLDPEALHPAATAFMEISTSAKTLILKGARAVGAKRSVDFSSLLATTAEKWERGIEVTCEYVATHATASGSRRE